MLHRIQQGALRVALLLLLSGCTPDPSLDPPLPPAPAPPSTTLTVHIHHHVDGQPLVLNQSWYKNENGDDYQVSEYKYYISHLELIAEDGHRFAEPEVYHLVDEARPGSRTISFGPVPPKRYHQLRLLIGVDSLRNVSGAQTGALDPLHGMFWTWNTGYIMAAFAGTSPQAGPIPQNLSFHIGGFSGPHSALRWVTLDLDLELEPGQAHRLDLYNNLNEWFRGAHLIDFSQFSSLSAPGFGASMMADNYATMFSLQP